MAIRIPIIADVVDAIRGAKQVGESFDDVADALASVDTKSSGAADGIADVGTAAGDTKRDADDMERSFRDAFDSVRKESKDAGDDVSTAMRHGTDGASEGMGDFKDEANATAKETAASFDGSAESITGAFQEVAANAFAGFGPAGALAGLAAAAGIGIVTAKLDEAKQKAADAAQEVADLTGQLIELGSSHLDVESVKEALEEAGSVAEDGKIPIQEWAKQADAAGIAFSDYAQGLAGDGEAIKRSYAEITAALNAQGPAYDKILAKYGAGSRQAQAFIQAAYDERDALLVAQDALEAKDSTLDKSARTYQLVTDAQRGLLVVTEEQAAADEKATQLRDAYMSALESSGDAVGVFSDILSTKTDEMRTKAQEQADATKEATGQAADSWEDYATDVTVSVDDLIGEWNRQAEAAAAFETNLATIAAAGGQALADELRAKGPEVAGAVADTIAKSDPSQQQQAIQAHARATGRGMSDAMGSGITDHAAQVQAAVNAVALGLTPPVVSVKLAVDKGDWDATKRRLMTEPLTVPVGLARSGTVVQ